MVGRWVQSIRRRIPRELAGVHTRGLGRGPDPVTFLGRSPVVPRDSSVLVVGSGRLVHLLEGGDIDLTQDGPEEADHLPSDGGGGDLVGLSGCQTVASMR